MEDLAKGKKRPKAHTPANEMNGQDKGHKGSVGVERPGKGVKREPDQSRASVKKGGDDSSSDEEEVKDRSAFEFVKGDPFVMAVVRNNTETGDEAIAKSIMEANGLGQGSIPGMRNMKMEKPEKKTAA